MDKQQLSRLMIGMAVAMLVVVGWSHVVQYLKVQHPEWWTTATTQPAEQFAATQPAATPTTTVVTTAPGQTAVLTTQPAVEAAIPAGLRVLPVQGASPALLGSSSEKDPTVT